MMFGFNSLVQPANEAAPADVMDDAELRLRLVEQALTAICNGRWDEAAMLLGRDPKLTERHAPCLNLIGVVCQARGELRRARRFYGKAMRADRRYAPAEQNLRRIYECDTFGSTNLPVALADQATLVRIKSLPAKVSMDPPTQRVSLWLRADATMDAVTPRRDWFGYACAIGAVALATALGWPLVHSRLHLAETNVLMLYLLSVLWVATHYSRGAAVLASLLGVAVFDFVFVPPYYTFLVHDEQHLVTFGVMLLTALVISSLTHRARLQAELARQAWERVETEFLRNTLLSGVSHELRTPLAAITGAATSLLETSGAISTTSRSDLLETICSESERMERLITNLLDMTRMEAGGMVVRKEWLPLQEVVGSTLRHLERRLDGRAVQIQLPKDLPLVQMDAVLIEQVLTNLIDNAVEYTPAGSAIEIGASASEDAIAINVADSGSGLPKGTETRVFDKFFRIRPSESPRGIGLGLAIVRGIVQAHGGEVSASNREAGGAVFRFTLPRNAPPTLVPTE